MAALAAALALLPLAGGAAPLSEYSAPGARLPKPSAHKAWVDALMLARDHQYGEALNAIMVARGMGTHGARIDYLEAVVRMRMGQVGPATRLAESLIDHPEIGPSAMRLLGRPTAPPPPIAEALAPAPSREELLRLGPRPPKPRREAFEVSLGVESTGGFNPKLFGLPEDDLTGFHIGVSHRLRKNMRLYASFVDEDGGGTAPGSSYSADLQRLDVGLEFRTNEDGRFHWLAGGGLSVNDLKLRATAPADAFQAGRSYRRGHLMLGAMYDISDRWAVSLRGFTRDEADVTLGATPGMALVRPEAGDNSLQFAVTGLIY